MKAIGNMGLVSFEKNKIKVNLYFAIVIFLLICIGVVYIVSWSVSQVEKIYHARMVSGIVHGIREPRGNFSIPDSPIQIKPMSKNSGEITIAGAGDEGKRKVWEEK